MKTILLILHDSKQRKRIAEILSLASYTVHQCDEGKTGAAHAISLVPDVILCATKLPKLDGFGVYNLLRDHPATANIPFVFLCTPHTHLEVRRAMEAGADDALSLSSSDEEILGAVRSRLMRAEQRAMMIQSFITPSRVEAGGMSEAELSALQQLGRLRRIKKGEVLYTDDSTPHNVYYVVRGKIKTYRTHELGRNFITGLYGAGEFLGHIAALERKHHGDSAQALDDCEVLVIPSQDFLSLLLHSGVMSQRFLTMLADELEGKDDTLVRLAYNSVRKRVADALLALERHYHESDQCFHMNISRENLANLAGTATETTIRTLHDFKEEKLIDIQGGTITILNKEKLLVMRQ